MVYDAIIVGGGPAGGSAAFNLAQAGWRILVLEKENLPRYKTCGGGVSPRMLAKYFPFSFEPVIENHCQSISYTIRGLDPIRIPLARGDLAMVMRERLDAFILSKSKAEVRQGCLVQAVREKEDLVEVETRSGEVFQARYLIGADGANSIVAREIGLRKHRTLVAAIEAEIEVPPAFFERFANGPVLFFGRPRLGYAWIFPKEGRLSVGVGGYRPKPGQLQATLKDIISEQGFPPSQAQIHGHPIPVYLPRPGQVTTRRVLLVGDAAGLVDPLSGEGIRMAIKSGQLAARALLAGKPKRYAALLHREIGFSQTLALPLVPIFYYLTELAFLLGVCNPFASQAFVGLLADRLAYPGVLLRIFGSLPAFIFTEALGLAAEIFGNRGLRSRIRSNVYGFPTELEKNTGG